ncbi:hypothetical protein O6H91_23G058000 [Diphasiastrum complanatum]|uniref:Uncharacterized protein n=2 Tax=Diphasiastrum complanatum TaxID=34168 RepID=A0ACC2AB27_DIPCM|nr:hypothetical protein O6H91_Y093700 [Diphasiastrum complanatum]KAJ7514750.1 hypothetical protein O6H91_23G058000 [Diphasiastrum complanatum]KAJ7514751.1 hypothetical protein O6H91_23G058000 [Diphasiastrum complanatum]
MEKFILNSCSHQHTKRALIVMASAFGWVYIVFIFLSKIGKDQAPSVLFPDTSTVKFSSNYAQQLRIYEQDGQVALPQQIPAKDMSAHLSISLELEATLPQKLVEFTAPDHDDGDLCAGKYIYMYDLPPRFNQDLIDNCSTLSPWTNMCTYLLNGGFGPVMKDLDAQFPKTGWYATNQFSLEVIFHNRIKRYKCLTTDYSLANAFFVPFYAGLDFSRYLYGFKTMVRDADSKAIARWLRNQPGWKGMGGKDHFMVGGRVTWDFRRAGDSDDEWGNKLLFLPGIEQMTMLVLEASPWFPNDVGIPYPTYFHPKHDSEIVHWQKRVEGSKRAALFCFAGAPRPTIEESIRESIIHQCNRSEYCRLLEQCDYGLFNCRKPAAVMKLFEESVFCLQPPGDSLTRRSIFDSMLAGCIPVFFHQESAYSQYVWHLPKNYTSYSVFISGDNIRRENLNIEKVLRGIPTRKIRRMREEVIRIIPEFIYADPEHHLQTMRDAFDITVQAVLDKVKNNSRSTTQNQIEFLAAESNKNETMMRDEKLDHGQ